jgi:hypothetical protein
LLVVGRDVAATEGLWGLVRAGVVNRLECHRFGQFLLGRVFVVQVARVHADGCAHLVFLVSFCIWICVLYFWLYVFQNLYSWALRDIVDRLLVVCGVRHCLEYFGFGFRNGLRGMRICLTYCHVDLIFYRCIFLKDASIIQSEFRS